MKTALIGLTFATALGLSGAHAMPVSSLPASNSIELTPVAQGCGPGMQRGPRGFCRPTYGPRRFYGPPRFAGPRCVIRRTPHSVRRTCRW
jgi:hypothetical protein